MGSCCPVGLITTGWGVPNPSPVQPGCVGGTQPTTMQTIELTDTEAEQLTTILEKNEDAVKPSEAVRWTPEAATEIASLRRDIEHQTE